MVPEHGVGRHRRRRLRPTLFCALLLSVRRAATSYGRVAPAAGGEEVDEQLVHALGLVVVDPVGRVGQALDPVEVGHVLVVRLGELGAEVAIALPPDDQGGRRDGAKLALLRRGARRQLWFPAVILAPAQ